MGVIFFVCVGVCVYVCEGRENVCVCVRRELEIKTLKYSLIQALRVSSVRSENGGEHKGSPWSQTHAITAAPDGSTKKPRTPPGPTSAHIKKSSLPCPRLRSAPQQSGL